MAGRNMKGIVVMNANYGMSTMKTGSLCLVCKTVNVSVFPYSLQMQ